MKNSLPFQIPFTGFTGLDFISTFTNCYIYITKVPLRGDGKCAMARGWGCTHCGNCETSNPMRDIEAFFFLFDTMCGRSATRMPFDGTRTEIQKKIGEAGIWSIGTPFTVDFLFGFAGYDYSNVTDRSAFKSEIIASIDADRPVIARIKDGKSDFAVIVGYENDSLIFADNAHAQNRHERALTYDDIESLYIFGDKITPRYTVKDGLKNIIEVMEYNQKQGVLMEYVLRLGWYSNGRDGMERADGAERKARMQRVCDTMWHTFNCHNFGEVFSVIRDDRTAYDNIGGMAAMHTPEIKELCKKIAGPCNGYTHDLAWALIGLNEKLRDSWENWDAFGYAEMIELTLTQINKNDVAALDAVKGIAQLLGEQSAVENARS